MKAITIHRLSLQFEADQITQGRAEEQAAQAIDVINAFLQRGPFGLSAQIMAARDEIEVESSRETPCAACGGQGWLRCHAGHDQWPQSEIQRCDACEQYDSDQTARKAAADANAPISSSQERRTRDDHADAETQEHRSQTE